MRVPRHHPADRLAVGWIGRRLTYDSPTIEYDDPIRYGNELVEQGGIINR